MSVDLSAAIECHRQGRLDEAARLYEAALAEDPGHADALHLRGLVALQQGDFQRAAELLARAVAARPDEASFHATLAEAYWALGQADRTVNAYRSALALQPDQPEYHCNLGATLVDLGALDEAIGHFRAAIRLHPEFAAAHNNLGNALRLGGDLAAAIDEFRQAARLDPTSSEARSNLGELLLDAGQPNEALRHCREAVGLQPGSPLALTNLGNVLHTLGEFDEAEACFREAIARRPDLASPHAALAGLLEELGDMEQSEHQLREALRRDPRHAGALARLATNLRRRLPEADLATIETMLADPALSPSDRLTLQFGLAQVRDAQGEYDRAAELAGQANASKRTEFQKRGKSYDPRAHEAFVDGLVAAFTDDYFARVREYGSSTRRPVFVVGLPRSGTTLVEQVLAGHPSVFAAGELQLVRETFQKLPQALGRDGTALECIPRLDRDTTRTLARSHESALQSLSGSAPRVVDKLPENALYLGWIATLFPEATIIYCRRDHRDVALSCWLTHLAQVRWACDIDHIAARINHHARLMEHWRGVLPVPIHEIDYESLVSDPEAAARGLIAWCGLEWDSACLRFAETRRPVRTASASQVRQPVHSGSVGRWKNYERALADLFAKIDGEPSSQPGRR